MTRPGSESIEITVTVQRCTQKALLVDHGGKHEEWIPRSMITDWSPDTDDDFKITSIFVPEWFATEKGLI